MTAKTLIALFFVMCSNIVSAQTAASCLFSAMYYEANLESAVGKKAVLQVVHNRARIYNKSVCQIIKQRGQFSWVGHKPFIAMTAERARQLIEIQEHEDVIGKDVLYFYNNSVKPKWARKMTCKRIGRHNFCADKLKEMNK